MAKATERIAVDWIPVDLSRSKPELPPPLNYQSGGKFWIVMDGGIHGRFMDLCHWTGERFFNVNNAIITHFAPVAWPHYPEEPADG